MVLIAPVTAPEDGLIYSNNNVKLKIGHKIIDTGILYISQNSLSWQPANNADGISISWKQVSLHGISTNPSKCIYFMLDHKIHWRGVYEGGAGAAVANGNGIGAAAAAAGAGGGGGDDMVDDAQNDCDVDEGNATDEEDGDDADDVPEEEQMTECWLLPDDVNTVDTIFQAMTECQALHPDSADSISDESDFMDDDDDDEDNNEERYGPNVPAHGGGGGGDDADGAQGGMRNLNLNDERFADADE